MSWEGYDVSAFVEGFQQISMTHRRMYTFVQYFEFWFGPQQIYTKNDLQYFLFQISLLSAVVRVRGSL